MRTKFLLESLKGIRLFVRRILTWEDNIKAERYIVGRKV